MYDDHHAYVAITRLQNTYGDISTRQAWDEMAGLAAPDARFSFDLRSGQVHEFAGAAEMVDFGRGAIDSFSFYEYLPLNTVVTVTSETTAHGRVYCVEVGQSRDTGEWLSFAGMYEDEYVVHDGAWRFASRAYSTLARRAGGAVAAFPFPGQG